MRYAGESLFFFIEGDMDRIQLDFLKKYYEVFNDNSFLMKNFIIGNNKNFYLSFTEKTYNDVSYLYTVYLLKLNYDINSMLMRRFYYEKINSELIEDKKYFFFYDILFIRNLHKINI
jgi:hypothetical protein